MTSRDPVRASGDAIEYPPRSTGEEIPIPSPTSLREQAVSWIVWLNSGSPASKDRRAFEAWLAKSPDHRREFEQVSKMWTVLDQTQPLLEAEVDRAEDLWIRHTATRSTESKRLWWSWGPQVVAAALVLVIAIVWWWVFIPEAMVYETVAGAQRQVTLTDGSTVTLNTDTKLVVEFSRRTRLIRLTRGEAWFLVQHEEQRPFTVQVANGVIQDIGTEFIVKQAPAHVKVSVLDGAVEVGVHSSDESPSIPPRTILHQGEQVSFGSEGMLSDVASFNPGMLGSWKDGKLIFRQQPLKQVLAEISRYRSEEIRLVDSSLETLPVSGVFHIQDLENALPFLEDALPIRSQRVQDNLIIVERAPTS